MLSLEELTRLGIMLNDSIHYRHSLITTDTKDKESAFKELKMYEDLRKRVMNYFKEQLENK